MKIKTKRNGELTETDYIVIFIGDERFRLTESVDGKLTINKISDGLSDTINVNPRYANEIDIS
jgi:hypothetical protein